MTPDRDDEVYGFHLRQEAPDEHEDMAVVARRSRLEDGLPVDEETMRIVLARAMDPAYPYPGLFYTESEEADLEGVDESVISGVARYSAEYQSTAGGTRMGWHESRRVIIATFTEDVEGHQAELTARFGDRVIAQSAPYPEEELWAIVDAIWAREDELREAGLEFQTAIAEEDLGLVSVMCIAKDEQAAREILTERFGPRIRVDWLGAAWLADVPCPFGSWTSRGHELTVFYATDHNGEQPRDCKVDEASDCVTVTVTIGAPVGIVTLVGGYAPREATVRLSAPLGDRTVIDGATGTVRPAREDLHDGA